MASSHHITHPLIFLLHEVVEAASGLSGVPSSLHLHAPVPLDDGADELSLRLAHEGFGGDGIGQGSTRVHRCIPCQFERQAVVDVGRQVLLVGGRVGVPGERERGGGGGDAPLLVLGFAVLLVLGSV